VGKFPDIMNIASEVYFRASVPPPFASVTFIRPVSGAVPHRARARAGLRPPFE
jgi:hypothetical protein